MSNKLQVLFLAVVLSSLVSCTISDKEFLEEISKSERIEIKLNFHGGIGGSGGINYTLKRSGYFPAEYDWILVREENTQFQTYVLLDTIQLHNFKLFMEEAFNSHDSSRVYQNTCTVIGSNPNDYVIEVNGYERYLKPDEKTDSLFYTLTDGFCLSKHVFE